ncbi:BCCT family transporter [Saccharopolyspora sp. HNM0983]|uniref:BCCT family transporter n=1 Tax=Saccharopolyspora montiporae TaxID=2781240 RepID=A0A929FYW1_9PSEU|nr:BCCT family transporter [Saccharopolyspora sp. HNM0983]MBE9373895.1 BCCT family transporter [Saccharopolyspora sp. HNM0983]
MAGQHETSQDEAPSSAADVTRPRTDFVVFGVTALLIAFFVGWGITSSSTLGAAAEAGLDWAVTNIGWGFVLASTGFVFFALWLAFSRYGAIPLGTDDESPEFRTSSWIAMMFSAGMGIGLMFFGVSEPLSHFVEPPPGTVAPGSGAAVEVSMATSLFHWTLHPWAIYAVVGLTIAYGSFRRGRKQLISAAFAPLIGERAAQGPLGRFIDILALFATLFGSAASLGIGTLQIRSGMEAAGWIGAVGNTVLVLIIVVLTMCFVASAVSGVARGIQWLSNINMVLAAVLAVFVFVAGPTVFILDLVPTAIGYYISDFGEMASRSGATGGEVMNEWLSTWTIFYWAWWISWAPFVGTFLARISRGRTIRQFVGGVMLVPSAVSVVWFAILGGSAIDLQRDGAVDVAGSGGEEAQTFTVIETLPLAGVTTVLVILLVAIFFVTGADSASIVMGTLSQRGSISPRLWVVVFWGVATGAVAAIMLISGGENALEGIQNLTFLASVPFALVMVFMCLSLSGDLRTDDLTRRGEKGVEVLEQAVIAGTEAHGEDFQLEIGPAEESDADSGEQDGTGSGADEGPAERD